MQDVIKKFKFKGIPTVVNAPTDLGNEFIQLGFATSLDPNAKSKDTLIFVSNLQEFVEFLQHHLSATEPDSVLWFAYPKGTSGLKTDVNRDILRVKAEAFGIAAVANISINATWSALRFRPTDRVGK